MSKRIPNTREDFGVWSDGGREKTNLIGQGVWNYTQKHKITSYNFQDLTIAKNTRSDN